MDTKERNQGEFDIEASNSDFAIELDDEESKKIGYVLSKIDYEKINNKKINIETVKELLIRNIEYIDVVVRYSENILNKMIPFILEKGKDNEKKSLKEWQKDKSNKKQHIFLINLKNSIRMIIL